MAQLALSRLHVDEFIATCVSQDRIHLSISDTGLPAYTYNVYNQAGQYEVITPCELAIMTYKDGKQKLAMLALCQSSHREAYFYITSQFIDQDIFMDELTCITGNIGSKICFKYHSMLYRSPTDMDVATWLIDVHRDHATAKIIQDPLFGKTEDDIFNQELIKHII